ncbi:hypothetical protein [Amphritea sp. HPY]|uniref:hypothetical protein n=1 Tax=Amphritea sp. HPY TaxID=3421652 RepID=UPI003D7D918E
MNTKSLLFVALIPLISVAAPPEPTATEVVVINCVVNPPHLNITASESSTELDPSILATGNCADGLYNLMIEGYELVSSTGSGYGNTLFTLFKPGK